MTSYVPAHQDRSGEVRSLGISSMVFKVTSSETTDMFAIENIFHAPGGTTYIVQRGDTLSRIARRFGVDMNVLARVNNITNVNRIYVGQRLTIPDFTTQVGS